MKAYNNLTENVINPPAASRYRSITASSQSIAGSPSTSDTTTSDDRHQNPSFDYVGQRINQVLFSPICVHPFVDPITHSSCGNTFCFECIQSISKCPICSEVDFKQNCSSPKIIRNMLDNLKVKCYVCNNNVYRGDWKGHREKYCPVYDVYKQVDELKLKLEEEFNQKNEQLKKEYFVLIQQLKRKHDQLIQPLKDEKEQSIKDAKKKIIKKHGKLYLELEKRIHEFDKQIHLKVRGTIMTVSLGDFIHNEREPDNLFKEMFIGQLPTSSKTKFKDSIYVECDPVIFKHIIEWLKLGIIDLELSGFSKLSLIHVCKMFQMNNLSKKLGDSKEMVKVSQESDNRVEACRLNNMEVIEILLDHDAEINDTALNQAKGFELKRFNIKKCDRDCIQEKIYAFKPLISKIVPSLFEMVINNESFIKVLTEKQTQILQQLIDNILYNGTIQLENTVEFNMDLLFILDKVYGDYTELKQLALKSIIPHIELSNVMEALDRLEKCISIHNNTEVITTGKQSNALSNLKEYCLNFIGSNTMEEDYEKYVENDPRIDPHLKTLLKRRNIKPVDVIESPNRRPASLTDLLKDGSPNSNFDIELQIGNDKVKCHKTIL